MNRAERSMLLLALGGLCLVWPAVRAAAQVSIEGWHLKVTDDRFTGKRSCRLIGGKRGHRLSFRPGVIIFHFPRNVDTLDAWYRIDGGPAVHWRDLFPELIAHGILPDDGPGLANPTDGRVMLPVAKLAGASEVWIRPSRHAVPRRFRLGDVTAATAGATAAHCTFGES